MKTALSKSRYTRGLQCHKSLWLYTHEFNLRTKPDAGTTARFNEGHHVGELAQQLFPGGVTIAYDSQNHERQVRKTVSAMKTAKVIYEATFYYDGVLVMADIMRKVRGSWELYEVKSSTGLKDIYQHDIAVQYHVISSSGIKISKACLVHINNEYVRKGAVDVHEFFTTADVTAEVKGEQAEVKKEIARQLKMLDGKEPKIEIGPYCEANYGCDYRSYCWKNIPDNSVFDLGGSKTKRYELYRAGFELLADIPLESVKGQQRFQVESFQKKSTVIEKAELHSFIKTLRYPLCFLDFETFQCAIPPYDGLKPYQQVPFQYSLHTLKSAKGKLQHQEYLAQPHIDPRKEFIDSLLEAIPEDACVLVYNKAFEVDKLKKLAEHFPRKRKRIQQIIDSVVDLMVPFQKRHLYSWKQQGSHSIKAVLPAFVKGMTYEGMEIGGGSAAMEAYHEMGRLIDKPKELAKLRKALLEYCCQDTLAMVRLLEVVEIKSKCK